MGGTYICAFTSAIGFKIMRNRSDRRTYARLDEINSAALHWRDELLEAAKQPDTAASVQLQNLRMKQIDEVMTTSLRQLREICRPDNDEAAEEDEWGAGYFTELDLIWKKISLNLWSPSADKPAAAIAIMQSCAAELDRMVYICMDMRLTPVMNGVLENVAIGQPLDIEFKWGKEFPLDPAMRKNLIFGVAQEGGVLNSAVVDAANGIVYRIPPKSEWWKGYVQPVILIVLFGLACAGLPYVKKWIPTWPIEVGTQQDILVGYIMWIVGAVMHVFIAALRQSRDATTPAFAAMNNWAIWINAKKSVILTSIAWIGIGYMIMVFLNLGLKLDWKAMLFAGYSADSFTELFIQRFESAASMANKALKGQLNPEANSPKGKGSAAS